MEIDIRNCSWIVDTPFLKDDKETLEIYLLLRGAPVEFFMHTDRDISIEVEKWPNLICQRTFNDETFSIFFYLVTPMVFANQEILNGRPSPKVITKQQLKEQLLKLIKDEVQPTEEQLDSDRANDSRD